MGPGDCFAALEVLREFSRPDRVLLLLFIETAGLIDVPDLLGGHHGFHVRFDILGFSVLFINFLFHHLLLERCCFFLIQTVQI